MSDLPKLRICGDPAIRGALCRGTWMLRRISARPSFALPRHVPPSSILRQAARVSSGPNSPSHADFSRALAGDSRGRAVAASGGRAEPAGAVPRARLPHARPVQFLSVELPRRSRDEGASKDRHVPLAVSHRSRSHCGWLRCVADHSSRSGFGPKPEYQNSADCCPWCNTAIDQALGNCAPWPTKRSSS